MMIHHWISQGVLLLKNCAPVNKTCKSRIEKHQWIGSCCAPCLPESAGKNMGHTLIHWAMLLEIWCLVKWWAVPHCRTNPADNQFWIILSGIWLAGNGAQHSMNKGCKRIVRYSKYRHSMRHCVIPLFKWPPGGVINNFRARHCLKRATWPKHPFILGRGDLSISKWIEIRRWPTRTSLNKSNGSACMTYRPICKFQSDDKGTRALACERYSLRIQPVMSESQLST